MTKTDILSEIADAIAARDTSVAALQAAQTRIGDLETEVARLQAIINAPPTTPAPDSSTGWSDLLVPPPGKLLLGTSTPAGGLESYRAATGRDPLIVHEYAKTVDQMQNDLERSLPSALHLQNWKPLGNMGPAVYQQILAGDADDELADAVPVINAYEGPGGAPLLLAIMHEPENDGPASGDLDYAAAFRYCVEHLRTAGARFLSVWNMMGWHRHGPRYDELWPGGDVVDWIASDPYSHSADHADFVNFVNQPSPDGTFPGFYSWAAAKGKPIMLGEWGIDSTVAGAVAPRMLTQRGVDRLLADMPLIRVLVYWNEWLWPRDDPQHDYRVSNFPTTFGEFAALPVFDVEIPSTS